VASLLDPTGKLGNYALTSNNGTLTVTPSPLTVTSAVTTRLYGDPTAIHVPGITELKNSDNITATYDATAPTPASPVGTYALVPVLSDPTTKLSNYAVTLKNGLATVVPAPLTVISANPTHFYGDLTPIQLPGIAGLKNGDNITTSYVTTPAPSSPVGTYPLVPALNDPAGKLGNYTVTIKNGLFTVIGARLVITANNQTKLVNAPLPPLTATYSGFVLAENPSVLTGSLSCTTTAFTDSPAGIYPITCSGQSATNYTITFVPGTLTVK
jgi:hypothetical protein